MSSTETLAVPGYQLLQFLGSGARSTIWEVRDRKSGERLALKRVLKRRTEDTRFLEQAANEYEAAIRLDHPKVRQIYRMLRVKRWFRLAEIRLFMELCEGHTVQDRRPREIAEVLGIFRQTAEALAHINDRGYVHADIKPNNIIVADDGTVKIIDLGQSCPIGTVKERIQGTPDFIAPEQVQRLPLDPRTDVFNFGAALYWTLTGRPIPTILPKKTSITLKDELIITPPEQINPQVSEPLSQLVLQCVAPEPLLRPKTMQAILSRIAVLLRKTDVDGPADPDRSP